MHFRKALWEDSLGEDTLLLFHHPPEGSCPCPWVSLGDSGFLSSNQEILSKEVPTSPLEPWKVAALLLVSGFSSCVWCLPGCPLAWLWRAGLNEMKSGVAGGAVLQRSIWWEANLVLESSLDGLLKARKRGPFKLPQETYAGTQEEINGQISGETEIGGCPCPFALVVHHENGCYRLNVCIPTNAYVEILTLNAMVLGGGAWDKLVMRVERSWMRLVSFWKRPQRTPSPLLPCEDTVRRLLSLNQEVGSHYTPYLPAPWSSTSQPPQLRNKICCYKPPQAVVFCYSSPSRQSQRLYSYSHYSSLCCLFFLNQRALYNATSRGFCYREIWICVMRC